MNTLMLFRTHVQARTHACVSLSQTHSLHTGDAYEESIQPNAKGSHEENHGPNPQFKTIPTHPLKHSTTVGYIIINVQFVVLSLTILVNSW